VSEDEIAPGITTGDALDTWARDMAALHPRDVEADWAALQQRVRRTSTMPSGWALWARQRWRPRT
jgi:hypothetical protein